MTFKVKGQGHKVMWSVWAVLAQWPINRKRTVVLSPKLAGGYPIPPMTHATLHTSFKVKRSKARVTGWLMQTHKICHIFRTARPKNFKVGVRMEDIDLHQLQAPWLSRLKIKVTRSDPCGPYCEIYTWYRDAYDRQSLWPPRWKIKVISSHRLYVSSLPLLNSGNKMLYLCH